MAYLIHLDGKATWDQAKEEMKTLALTGDFPFWLVQHNGIDILSTSQIGEAAQISGHFVLEQARICFSIDEMTAAAWDLWFENPRH